MLFVANTLQLNSMPLEVPPVAEAPHQVTTIIRFEKETKNLSPRLSPTKTVWFVATGTN